MSEGTTRLVLLVHLVATLYMTGLVCFVQIVHYPLFARVGAAGFAEYEAAHSRRTTLAVAPAMLAEAATAVALVALEPAGVPASHAAVGLVLLAIVWLSTATLSVPAHRRLAAGFDPRAHARLVATNWIRTLGWTARASVAVAMIGGAMGPA